MERKRNPDIGPITRQSINELKKRGIVTPTKTLRDYIKEIENRIKRLENRVL